jgi:curved DNA-binding protein CbpA
MAGAKDYYSILGVSVDSEDVVIHAAYRALMRRYHPDINQTHEGAKRSQSINEAYDVLRDPARRATYDSAANAHRKTAGPPPSPEPPKHEEAVDPPNRRLNPWRKYVAAAAALTVVILLVVNAPPTTIPQAAKADNFRQDMNETTQTVATDDAATVSNSVEVTNLAVDTSNSIVPAVPLPTLATISQSPVEFTDIEAGANRFARVLTKGGMAAARIWSTGCHDRVKSAPSWSAADQCAAFDYSAAYVDDQIARQSQWPANQYFAFQNDNQGGNYEAAGAANYLLTIRLDEIRRSTQPLAAEALRDELARMQAFRSSALASPPGGAPTNLTR